MASHEAIKFSLGETAFKVRPLTVAQIREIEGHLQSHENLGVDGASAIVSAGIRRDYPDVDIAEAETTVKELSAAMIAILQLGGFFDAPGEAPAAAASALTGGTSTGASARRLAKRPAK